MESNFGTGGTLPISPISRGVIRINKRDKTCYDEEKQNQGKKKQKDKEDDDAIDILVEGDYGKENMDSSSVNDEGDPEKKEANSEKVQKARKIDIII